MLSAEGVDTKPVSKETGVQENNWLTPITLRLGCALAREEMVASQPRSAQKIPQAEFFNKEHDIQLSCLDW